ncbi:unnamed protein product [Didymodactylos carnosus]|uniref:Uncharacterized protein n=1 Tax=Didymodactylos carnosus TaxID=1234261 RepID=A0A813QMQ9_9BILA|nr:unnamed protein product [Didymodactylos carnosus]CAF0791230.1 unnamed protein product [Didymodactylos carnosus]CAF3551131.1 unnamed protein product [Didymodactylos carnosus]CAF3573828.1 unnamed protein product [Didymodactylos carnosus]
MEESKPQSETNSTTATFVGQTLLLFRRLAYDIWTSPVNLILVILIVLLLIKLYLMKRKPNDTAEPAPVQLPKMKKCDMTLAELHKYDGKNSDGRVLTAIYGDIFDVSRRIDLYGPGGSYCTFAGRDATRALAKMQLDASLFTEDYDNLENLTDNERSTARAWHDDFKDKYDIVGRVLRPGESPTVYTDEVDSAQMNDFKNFYSSKDHDNKKMFSPTLRCVICQTSRCDQPLHTEQATDTLNLVNKRLTNLYQNQTSLTSTNLSLNESTPFIHSQTRRRMYQVRRTFLLIVAFDLIFMILLWIIYDQILNRTIIDAFHIEIEQYSIKTSLFDVVELSALRFILLMVPYAIMRWSHLIFVSVINERPSDQEPLINDNNTPDYHSITMRSSIDRQSFYSPIPSVDGSDVDDVTNEDFRNVLTDTEASAIGTPTSIDFEPQEDYEKCADDVMEELWKIFKDTDGWSLELKSNDGEHTVVSKTYPKWSKVFKLTVLEVVNTNLFISYQLTPEQAHGVVAKRDFVNLSVRRFIDNVAVLGARACLHINAPPKDNCVRGENGPTAYIIEKIDDSTSKFTWILNVDLKGWLPQYIINQSLASVQIELIESLRKYVSKTTAISPSITTTASSI